MIIYHGTSWDRGIQINEDGVIKVTTVETTVYPQTELSDTSFGYVYLTTDIDKAVDFALRPMPKNQEMKIIIYEIELDEAQLEVDSDEKKHDPFSDTEYRIKKDLVLGEEVQRYLKVTFKDYQHACQSMDSKIISKRSNKFWKNITKKI